VGKVEEISGVDLDRNLPEVHVHVSFGRMNLFRDDAEDTF
jgi:hypothetical protein